MNTGRSWMTSLKWLSFLVAMACCGCRMSASGHNVDGVRMFQQGQHQSAMDKFQRAISVNPNNADAYYNMAATLHDWGRRNRNENALRQAEGLYHQCLDVNADHVECHRALAVLLADQGRRDSAMTLLERWAVRSPQLADPQIELARLHEEFGQQETAKQYLTRALDVDATSPRAWAALGRLREREGQYAQALTNYQHAYNLSPRQSIVGDRIASLQSRLGSTITPGRPVDSGGNNAPFDSGQVARTPSQWVPR